MSFKSGKETTQETQNWQHRIKHIEVALHILTWCFLFIFPHLISIHRTGDHDINSILTLLGFPTTLAITFYINYLWLVPRYMTLGDNNSKRKRITYTIYSILLMALAMNANFLWLKLIPNDICYLERYANPHIIAEAFPKTFIVQTALFLHDLLWYTVATVMAIFISNIHTYWRIRTSHLEVENRLMLSQASPHFLLNTLNGIYTLIAIDPPRAQDAVHRFSKMLSYMIYEMQLEYTTLQREAEFIEQYVSLMKLRLTTNASITYDHSLGNMQETLIPPMLLQPLVENAFKHGITNEKPCHVDITLNVTNGILRLLINNSNNPKKQSDRRSHGIGLGLIRQRLNSYYPKRHKLKFHISANGIDHITELAIKLN